MSTLYQCPICASTLLRVKADNAPDSLKCENNHSFDYAKEGYVNLLPAHHKQSKLPGDSAEMMQARRAFLDAGHYQPLADALTAKVLQANIEIKSILDIGCGEGFYTQQLEQGLSLRGDAKTDEAVDIFGVDISKAAIRYASKRYRNVNFSVASVKRLPFPDNSFDCVVKVYAPSDDDELCRVMCDNAKLICVTPGPRHLYQLKSLIYSAVRLHPELPPEFSGLSLERTERLTYAMNLSGREARQLLSMTPFAWRASEAVKNDLYNADRIDVDADFVVSVYSVNA